MVECIPWQTMHFVYLRQSLSDSTETYVKHAFLLEAAFGTDAVLCS